MESFIAVMFTLILTQIRAIDLFFNLAFLKILYFNPVYIFAFFSSIALLYLLYKTFDKNFLEEIKGNEWMLLLLLGFIILNSLFTYLFIKSSLESFDINKYLIFMSYSSIATLFVIISIVRKYLGNISISNIIGLVFLAIFIAINSNLANNINFYKHGIKNDCSMLVCYEVNKESILLNILIISIILSYYYINSTIYFFRRKIRTLAGIIYFVIIFSFLYIVSLMFLSGNAISTYISSLLLVSGIYYLFFDSYFKYIKKYKRAF